MNDFTVQDLWAKAAAHLQEKLHPDVYSRWIAVIVPDSLSGDDLGLRVDNNFYQSWLEDNYLPIIRDALAAVSGKTFKITFKVAPPSAPSLSMDRTASTDSPDALARRRATPPRSVGRRPAAGFETNLNRRYTFEEFIVGPSNHFSHAAALAVSQSPGRAYNPLFIYGGSGLGKTHLIQAIGHSVLKMNRLKVAYLSCETFLNEYIDAIQNKSHHAFRNKYRNIDLLLIDDIHFLAGKQGIQEEFFHTFNALSDAHKQIVLSSDRPPSDLKGVDERLVTRFNWGLVTEVQPPEFETRLAILRYKKEQAQIHVNDQVIEFIAQSVRSNIRSLEGALTRVASYASLKGRDLSIPELENLLRDILEKEHEKDLTFDLIMRTVADHFDIRLTDMTSKRRPQAVSGPRQVAMYLCRTLTSSSLPEIASAFGKTHATILHAYHAIEKRMAADPTLKQDVSRISHALDRRD